MKKAEQLEQLHYLIAQIRKDHPRMSVKKLYSKMQVGFMGRDQFLSYCKEQGWMQSKPRNHRRTTHSVTYRFPNLIAAKWVTDVNQVWVSDITYLECGDRFCYATFITDLYSRRIIGYSLSTNLTTINTTLPALKRALNTRKSVRLSDLIFHSDGGGQYYEKTFTALLRKHQITSSMAYSVYENPHAESLNGIIKNEYLYCYQYSSMSQLKQKLSKVIHLYNKERPHGKLNMKTPIETELIKTSFKVKVSSYTTKNYNQVTPTKGVINI